MVFSIKKKYQFVDSGLNTNVDAVSIKEKARKKKTRRISDDSTKKEVENEPVIGFKNLKFVFKN